MEVSRKRKYHYKCNRSICSQCSYNKKNVKRRKYNVSKHGNSYNLEHKGYLLLKKYVKKQGILHLTNEGCKADILFKPLTCKKNLWLPIQLKTTNEVFGNGWQFSNCNDYNNYLMCCIYLKDEKFWLFNGSLCSNLMCLRISDSKNNKYKKYLTNGSDIISTLLDAYKNSSYKKLKYATGMLPQPRSAQVELYHKKLRSKLLPFLNIYDLDIMYDVVDVIINNRKVQDKTGYRRVNYKYAIMVNLNKHYGIYDSISYRGPYCKGDNDYYWIHLPGKYKKTHFYCIPEGELSKRGYIKSYKSCGKHKIVLYPEDNVDDKHKSSWANKYMYEYKKIKKSYQIFK